mmetsp:Transcript_42913/g.80056  ORF Transcript_42913/g.80056 Transcript_42913/m.80056 type:complete len:212 (+) Transcript_42913:107-742(+)
MGKFNLLDSLEIKTTTTNQLFTCDGRVTSACASVRFRTQSSASRPTRPCEAICRRWCQPCSRVVTFLARSPTTSLSLPTQPNLLLAPSLCFGTLTAAARKIVAFPTCWKMSPRLTSFIHSHRKPRGNTEDWSTLHVRGFGGRPVSIVLLIRSPLACQFPMTVGCCPSIWRKWFCAPAPSAGAINPADGFRNLNAGLVETVSFMKAVPLKSL